MAHRRVEIGIVKNIGPVHLVDTVINRKPWDNDARDRKLGKVLLVVSNNHIFQFLCNSY